MSDEGYITVKTSPELWKEGEQGAKPVVRRGPWRHSNFSIAGIKVRGRMAWAASEPVWSNEVTYYDTSKRPLRSILDTIVIHHTNNSFSISYNESRQRARGFACLGYHFFIDTWGIVYEGRPLEVMGSHAGAGTTKGVKNDPDWGAIGIVLQGDYQRADNMLSHSKPQMLQLKKLDQLVRALLKYFTIRRLLMHREIERSGAATECPGDQLVPHITALRSSLGLGSAR